jgi:hypothetical protein
MADLPTRFEHQTMPIMVRHGFLQGCEIGIQFGPMVPAGTARSA